MYNSTTFTIELTQDQIKLTGAKFKTLVLVISNDELDQFTSEVIELSIWNSYEHSVRDPTNN